MPARFQKYRLKWPITPFQWEGVDEMLSEIYSDLSTNALGIPTATSLQGIVPMTGGGTGVDLVPTIGDIFYADSPTTLKSLHDIIVGNVLLSGGVGVPPSWGKVSLTSAVSGILPVGSGGTGNAVGFATSAGLLNPGNTINGVLFTGASPITISGGGGGGGGIGPPGFDGDSYDDWGMGIPGPQGIPGGVGPTGVVGPVGFGFPGTDGDDGQDGVPGPQGPRGPAGAAGGSGSLVLLEQHTASSSTSLNFTTAITSLYDEYIIELINIIPAATGPDLLLQFSTDGGSTYSATGYEYIGVDSSTVNVNGTLASASATGILLFTGIDNAQSFGTSGRVILRDPLNASLKKTVEFHISSPLQAVARRYTNIGSGFWDTTTAVNAVRFIFSSGNITSGTIRIYGVSNVVGGLGPAGPQGSIGIPGIDADSTDDWSVDYGLSSNVPLLNAQTNNYLGSSTYIASIAGGYIPVTMQNLDGGAGSFAEFIVKNDLGHAFFAQMLSSGVVTSGATRTDGAKFTSTGAGGIALISNNATGGLVVYAGGNTSSNLGITLYPSRGIDIGPSPSDPGASNVYVEGNVNAATIGSGGTWTPIDSSGASLAFSFTNATYLKIGQLVFITFQVVYPNPTVSALPALIGGLPFTCTSVNTPMSLGYQNGTLAFPLVGYVIGGTTTFQPNYISGAGADVSPTNTQLSAINFIFGGCYRTV